MQTPQVIDPASGAFVSEHSLRSLVCVPRSEGGLGKLISILEPKHEEWSDTEISDPAAIVDSLKKAPPGDIFTFAQKIPNLKPTFDFYYEWDNAAVIPLTTFEDWWGKRLPQVTRKNVRRSAKRGVVANEVEFNDHFISEVVQLFKAIKVKQGKAFAHQGKDFHVVKQELSEILQNTCFLGAYFEGQLIGYIKIVITGKVARIMNIIADDEHYDKRPMNVLLCKLVEVCLAKKCEYIAYGKYIYGNKLDSPLTEFKRRNGFEKLDFPRYFIPRP
jgi:hypothetical protein